MSEKLPTSGDFQAPPPDAPRETAQPLQPELLDQQLALAARFEQPLKPFNPQPMAPPVHLDQELTLADVAKQRAESRIVLTDADAPYRPAESNTDSPSRGIPQPQMDPQKAITGGWGPSEQAQYFPLDGNELRVLVESLLDKLREQIRNDLHFSVAVVYPRVEVRVAIEIGGYTEAQSYALQKRALHDKTPLEIAKAVGEPIAETFAVVRAEFDPDGEPVDPPDRIRDSLGLTKPHKQVVETGGGRMIVDIVPSIDGNF